MTPERETLKLPAKTDRNLSVLELGKSNIVAFSSAPSKKNSINFGSVCWAADALINEFIKSLFFLRGPKSHRLRMITESITVNILNYVLDYSSILNSILPSNTKQRLKVLRYYTGCMKDNYYTIFKIIDEHFS